MGEHMIYNKRRLCYTEISDYTNYQGIGQDLLYKRYDSVFNVVSAVVDKEYTHFLAQPIYSNDIAERIDWYIENWVDLPQRYTMLNGVEKERYTNIKNETISHYKESLSKLDGNNYQILVSALKFIDDESIYCYDGKVALVAWGMTPDTNKHQINGAIIHEFQYKSHHKIEFDCGEFGSLKNKSEQEISRTDEFELSQNDLPEITPNDGYEFTSWLPDPIGMVIKSNTKFVAQYSKLDAVAEVVEDNVAPIVNVEEPAEPTVAEEPVEPIKSTKEKIPWYKRLWLFLTGKGCLKWLLWILLFLLFFFLLSLFLRSCNSCSRDRHVGNDRVDTIVQPIDNITTPDGDRIDDNNNRDDIGIINEDGRLPDNGSQIVAPIVGGDGSAPPVIEENPGMPKVIANRLNIFFEDEDADLDAFVNDFKKIYASDEYKVIGFDDNVKMIQIQIPEEERNEIRETINDKLPDYDFFVVDESIFNIVGNINDSGSDAGWHLKAINLSQAWKITKGDPKINVAIVDDGIDSKHPIFKDRIRNAYNVFTQNNKLSLGDGHGTHVAGLAVGSDEFISDGVSGVAPNCMIMPIQVFDNNMCTFSTLASGIMYAIHNDADVVNISIGPSFVGLNLLPEKDQQIIAQTQFKNEEKVWQRIIKIANDKNCILVFAVGNDKVLANIPPENRFKSSINVAAIDKDFSAAKFSNYAEGANISAPGVDIYSSVPNNNFKFYSGTSMAAPIVTGAIALMKSIDKDINVEHVKSILQNTGKRTTGNVPPALQVDKALQVVQSGDYDNFPSDDDESVEDNKDTTNYDSIRGLIEDHKNRISDLERQLPESKNK